MTTRHSRSAPSLIAGAILAALVLTAVLLVSADGASAQGDDEWPTLSDLGFEPPSDSQATASVRRYEVRDSSVRRYGVTDRSVLPVDTVDTDGGETVVNLSSDILFDFDEADLSAEATQRVAELVADIPQGAAVSIGGHTDSVGDDAYNLDLSQRRADAVAAAVAAARSDLVLDVTGFGETRPKVTEAGDDIGADQAANRRVEIRYTA